MTINDFEEKQLSEDVVCDNCGYTIIKGSVAYQNFEDDVVFNFCSPCINKLRGETIRISKEKEEIKK